MIANEFNPPRADVLMYMGGFGSSFPCETLNSGLCVCSEVTTDVGDSDVILLLSMPSGTTNFSRTFLGIVTSDVLSSEVRGACIGRVGRF